MRKWISGGVLVALVFVLVGCKVVSTPNAPNGWAFANEGANGSGYYVNGPGNPPAGRGSALLTIDGTGREAIATASYSGIGLSPITQLSYSTYQAYSGSPNETPALSFDVDYDATDSSTAYQGRLVFVPSASAPVVPKVWQTWNTMSGPAWYSSASGGSSFRPVVADNPQASPPCSQQTVYCSWSTILSDYPNARIRPTVSGIPGILLLRAGGPVTLGFSGAVDNFVIGIGSNIIENNFEPGDGHIAVNQTNAASLGFSFADETNAPGGTGSGSFVSGPNGADGAGSAKLTVNQPGGEALSNGLFSGTRLKSLSFLSYKTYKQAVGNNVPTLQLDADYDSTDASTAYQGRLVFEPSVAGEDAIASETWQTWNPLTSNSGWWQTGNAVVGGVTQPVRACPQVDPCSFQELIAAFPNVQIRPLTGQVNGQPTAGGMWLKAGSNWPGGFDGNVDSLTIGLKVGTVNGTVTYDFEG